MTVLSLQNTRSRTSVRSRCSQDVRLSKGSATRVASRTNRIPRSRHCSHLRLSPSLHGPATYVTSTKWLAHRGPRAIAGPVTSHLVRHFLSAPGCYSGTRSWSQAWKTRITGVGSPHALVPARLSVQVLRVPASCLCRLAWPSLLS
jgi:hypothetical protein